MITTIIFDFAGVLTTEGFRSSLLKKLSPKYSFDNQVFNTRFEEHEEEYMAARIDDKEFWERVCEGLNIPYEDYASAFATAYQLNPAMVTLIEELKKQYRIILFSDNFNLLSQQLRKDPQLAKLFEKMFFSNEMKLTKSNPASFKYILGEIKEIPEKCVFTDDKERKLTAAKELGIKTIHFKNVEDFKKELEAIQ
jgi:HAD superfamily hydrolase (TIGR01509 family)